MAVYRVTAEWTGFTGSPGYSVFHFSAIEVSIPLAQAAADAVRAFFKGIDTVLPSIASIRVLSSVQVVNEATGQLENDLAITSPPVVTGLGAGAYSAPSGAVVHWLTTDVKNGRRVRGRNFLVPLTSAAYDGAGSLTSAAVTSINTAAAGLRATTPALQVFSRPSMTGAADGSAHLVTGSRVPDMAAILRSRRD